MRMKGEQQLFDPGPARSMDHPGDLTYEEWSARPDVVHHSTFTRDWSPRDSEVSHYGTLSAAQDNAVRNYKDMVKVAEGTTPSSRPGGVEKDLDGWSDTYALDVADATGPGVIHSRRIEEASIMHEPMQRKYSGRSDLRATDAEANVGTVGFEVAAHVRYPSEEDTGYPTEYEHTAGVRFNEAEDYAEDPDMSHLDSTHPVARVIDSLYDNRPVSYENEVEDQGSTSYVAPWNSVSSWEQDVQASPNRPQHVKDAVAAQPRPRTTPFDGNSRLIRNVSHKFGADVHALKSQVIQPALFGEQGEIETPRTGLHDGSRYHVEFPREIPNPVHTARDKTGWGRQ